MDLPKVKTSRRDKIIPKLFKPREIYEYLDKYVIGQERAKKVISIAAHNHLKRTILRRIRGNTILKKSNVLLIGPTGCGKTHIARCLANFLEVPFTVVDVTEYTEAGYYGKDVEVMISELLYSCDFDIELAEIGIVFIDEVDKIARKYHGAQTGAAGRDIGGEGVQQALLKLLEGSKLFVLLNLSLHWNKCDFVEIDTTDILFICAGTFTDLFLYKDSKKVGFEDNCTDYEDKYSKKQITVKDLIEYGMLAEFMGRLPVIVQLHERTREQLKRILVEAPDSLLNEYKLLLNVDGKQLVIREEALDKIVDHAIKRKLGARGLRSIMEIVMEDILFEAPELKTDTIIIEGSYVEKKLKENDFTL